ncbi:hypothetical protein [Jiella pelagia]|uniref:Uncharacterized protein n=1 Tax=Jiella pelagia TaxID=2986949 RepID=A0ABY7C5G7_9HYPH|nr:hypothetical protein [Jiella pelagia]WAP69080.1 hypothetical protein OH818_01720 [Jiella pelagia]
MSKALHAIAGDLDLVHSSDRLNDGRRVVHGRLQIFSKPDGRSRPELWTLIHDPVAERVTLASLTYPDDELLIPTQGFLEDPAVEEWASRNVAICNRLDDAKEAAIRGIATRYPRDSVYDVAARVPAIDRIDDGADH